MPFRRILLVGVLIATGRFPEVCELRGEDRPADAGSRSQPAADQAERRKEALAWIAELGSPRFEVREAATTHLEQAGIEAVEPLLAAAEADSLEVTCRAVRALGSIFESADDDTFDAAELALEKLAESSNRSAARRATMVLYPENAVAPQDNDSQRLRRRKRAIVRIRALGGIVQRPKADPKAERVRLIGPRVAQLIVVLGDDWKGGGAGLVNVKRLAARYSLPQLYVTSGSRVPADALDSLRRALPNLKIEERGPQLGISCLDEFENCEVTYVKPECAADKAGIRTGDVIVRYDGESLKNFRSLIDITQRHKAGDKLAVEVRRNGEPLKLEVQLTGWEDPDPESEDDLLKDERQ